MRASLLLAFALVASSTSGQTYLGKADEHWLKLLRDGDGKEWIYVPSGTCDRIVGGSKSAK